MSLKVKITIYLLIIILSGLLIYLVYNQSQKNLSVSADIIPEDDELVQIAVCSKITNSNSYNNTVFIARVWQITNGEYSISNISEENCITKGYKFNQIELFVARQDYIDKVGIENIDFESNNVLKIVIYRENTDITLWFRDHVEGYTMYIDESDGLNNILDEYRFLGFSDQNIPVVCLLESTNYYDEDGDSYTVDNFNAPDVAIATTNINDVIPAYNALTPTPTPTVQPTSIPTQTPASLPSNSGILASTGISTGGVIFAYIIFILSLGYFMFKKELFKKR